MYEQGPWEASLGELVHDLSESDVNEAYVLAQYGYQRLRPISEATKTFFNFTISFSQHTVRVVYRISPANSQETGCSQSDVDGGCWPCCHQVVEYKIKPLIQLVYNSCILVNRQPFDDAHLRIFPSTSSLCPREHILLLAQPNDKTPDRYDQSDFERPSLTLGQWTFRPSTTTSKQQDGHDKERRCSSSDNLDARDPDREQRRTKKRKRPETDEDIANQVIKNVEWGMRKMTQRESAFDPFASTQSLDPEQIKVTQIIVSKLEKIRARYSDCEDVEFEYVKTQLEELQQLFDDGAEHGEMTKKAVGVRQWWYRYYSSCTGTVLRLWREAEPDRSASAAKVIHYIVNDLIPTEGIKSVTVIAAFAEQTYYLSNVTSVSQDRQLVISKLVADGLRGQLKSPPDCYLIPMAVVCVSVVTRLSHREAYCRLGCPNLAMLQLDTAWNPNERLELSKAYSFLLEKWAPFARYIPFLRHKCSKLTGWTEASQTERFAMMVEEWYNLRQFQHQGPPPSSNMPRGDVSTGSTTTITRVGQRSLLTASSSEPHALIDIPFIAERNQAFISDRSRVSHSPSPPQALLVSENLFHNIKVYFENSCRNIILDDHGILLAPNGGQLQYHLCNDFDSYCFTATMLVGKGLPIEFGRALSKASALVEQILRAEHPRTLACFLEVLIHLTQTGLFDIASTFRDFIKRMSAKVTKKGHPWGEIYRLLGEVDSESLNQVMAQTWKCTSDTFDFELGTLSPLAVSVRLDYIKRVYGMTNCLEEERLLRDLLARFGGTPGLSTPRVMLNLAHNLNRQSRYDEAEKMARKVLSLLHKNKIYAGRVVERIESLKIVSRSRFNQQKALAAEQTMREAIRMIVDQWGRQHPWVSEFMNVLEDWLRVWGREEEANALRGEIDELMGEDGIVDQLDGVRGFSSLRHLAGRN